MIPKHIKSIPYGITDYERIVNESLADTDVFRVQPYELADMEEVE